MAKQPKREAVSLDSILANPSDKSKLEAYIAEAVIHKEKIKFEQEGIKDIRDDAFEQIGLEPKTFNDLVKIKFKGNYTEVKDQISDIESALEILFKDSE
jgi:hypothetical protein